MSDVLLAPRSLGQAWGVKPATPYQQPQNNGTYGVRTGLPQSRPRYGGYRSDGFNRFANTPGASAPARAQQLSPTQVNPVAAVGTKPQVPSRIPAKTPVRMPAPANPLSKIPQNARAGAAVSAALTGLSLYNNLQQGQGPFEAASGALTQPLTSAAGLLSDGLLAGPLNLGNGYAAALSGADSDAIGEATNRFNPSLGADAVADTLTDFLTAPGRALDNFFGFGRGGSEGGPKGDYVSPVLPFTGGQTPGVRYKFKVDIQYGELYNEDTRWWYGQGPIEITTGWKPDRACSVRVTGNGATILETFAANPVNCPVMFHPKQLQRVDGEPDTGGNPPAVPTVTTPPFRPHGRPATQPQNGGAPNEPPAFSPLAAAPLAIIPGLAAGALGGSAAPSNLAGPGPSRSTAPAKPPSIPKSPALPSQNPSKRSGGGGPTGHQPPTKKNTQCGCNKGLLNGVKNLLSGNGLTAANTALLAKIDATTTATGAGVVANLTKLQTLQTFMETAWKATHADKIINLLTLTTTLHNASMISRDIGETMGYVLSNALAVVGIKDEHDNPLNVNELVGNSVENFIKRVVGEEVYENTATFWQKSNRVLSAASNIVWTIRSINDVNQEVLEWTAENTGKIGNALKKHGVVGERAYPWMAERVRAQDSYRRKLSGVFDRLDSAENVASSLSQVTSNVREIQDEVSELREARQRFTDAVSDLAPDETPTASPENQVIATANIETAAASQGPAVNMSTDGSRGPDPHDTP